MSRAHIRGKTLNPFDCHDELHSCRRRSHRMRDRNGPNKCFRSLERWTLTNDQNQPPDDILLQRLVIDVQKLGTRIADRQFAKLTLATLLG